MALGRPCSGWPRCLIAAPALRSCDHQRRPGLGGASSRLKAPAMIKHSRPRREGRVHPLPFHSGGAENRQCRERGPNRSQRSLADRTASSSAIRRSRALQGRIRSSEMTAVAAFGRQEGLWCSELPNDRSLCRLVRSHPSLLTGAWGVGNRCEGAQAPAASSGLVSRGEQHQKR